MKIKGFVNPEMLIEFLEGKERGFWLSSQEEGSYTYQMEIDPLKYKISLLCDNGEIYVSANPDQE